MGIRAMRIPLGGPSISDLEGSSYLCNLDMFGMTIIVLQDSEWELIFSQKIKLNMDTHEKGAG